MPARDLYHTVVRQALVQDGWAILAEDYPLEYEGDRLYADIAAEKAIAAERQGQKIIVEVKSFLGRSFMKDLELAVGQYIVYRNILQATSSDFQLYLAIPARTYNTGFQKKLAQLIVQSNQVNLLVFSPEQEVIEKWIS